MILVTGGSGLVGRELILQLLRKGRPLKAIFHNTEIKGIQDPNFTQVQCDILDVVALEEVMTGVDELYHCAGFISYAPKDHSRLFKVNVEGTANVVNAALNAGVKKMLHVSSVSAIGRPAEAGNLIDESQPWNASSNKMNYGHSKYLGELEVWRGIAEGLSAVIINPSIIFGNGNWNDGSTRIFRSMYDELPWYTEGVTGFVDVRDVAKAMIMLMESEIVSQRFIVSAENQPFRNVFNMIATAFKKKAPSRKATPFIAGIYWRYEALKSKFTGIDPIVTKETAASALAMQNFDNAKLIKCLPAFNYYPLAETIAHTCAALQQKLNNH